MIVGFKSILHRCIGAAATLLLFGFSATFSANAAIKTAEIAQGSLQGIEDGGVTAFLGVPYAEPPVGGRRWRAPEPAKSWQGVRSADRFSPICQQNDQKPSFAWSAEFIPTQPPREDCLYLNVWTSAATPNEKLPVFVWIHGGGFTEGSGSTASVNGAGLSAQGLVVVTINYRLGVYGFLAHPELSKESGTGSSGNYGLQDQIAALQWVKQNISAFGGDPARVTIGGQSAGSLGVNFMIFTPLTKGLFRGAISESSLLAGRKVFDRQEAEKNGLNIQLASGAKSLEEMRRLTTAQLTEAATKSLPGILRPIVDGYVIPSPDYLESPTSDTPIIAGMNANEVTPFLKDYGNPAATQKLLSETFGASLLELEGHYKIADPIEMFDAIWRDRGLATYDAWAQRRLQKTKHPIYLYLFNHVLPGPDARRYKSFHNAEIPYVFKTFAAAPQRTFTAEDHALADLVSSYWVNFIKSGTPNGGNLPTWPAFGPAERLIQEIGVKTETRPILSKPKLDFFHRFIEAGGKQGVY